MTCKMFSEEKLAVPNRAKKYKIFLKSKSYSTATYAFEYKKTCISKLSVKCS